MTPRGDMWGHTAGTTTQGRDREGNSNEGGGKEAPEEEDERRGIERRHSGNGTGCSRGLVVFFFCRRTLFGGVDTLGVLATSFASNKM